MQHTAKAALRWVRHLRPGRRLRRAAPRTLSFILIAALLFTDVARLLPKDLDIDLRLELPNGTLLSTRLQLELQRWHNELARLGPQPAVAQSNPAFSHYWNYKTSTTPALASNDAYATFYVKEQSILYVGTASGVNAIDFLTNTTIASYATGSRVNALHAAGGEIAAGTDNNGVYVLTPSLTLVQQYTQPTLYNVWGNNVQDVKLVKDHGLNLLLSMANTNGGLTIVDRANSNTPYYYRFDNNYGTGVDYDSTDPDQLYIYASYDNGGNVGGIARFPWRANTQAVNNETLTYVGQVGGLYTYQSAHAKWMADPAPTVTPFGAIDRTLGRVQYGAQPGSAPTASYSFWARVGVDSAGSDEPVDVWRTTSSPALTQESQKTVRWHAPTAAFYGIYAGHWLFGGATVTRIKSGAALSYNPSNNPGLQNAVYKRVAKEADDLYIATGQGVSRIQEVSGQITVASTTTTGNGSYDVRDLALDGPVLFTAESTNGETILYRGTAADAHNRLGRGTCDTNPLVSNEVSGCNGNASYSETDLTLPGKGSPSGSSAASTPRTPARARWARVGRTAWTWPSHPTRSTPWPWCAKATADGTNISWSAAATSARSGCTTRWSRTGTTPGP